VVGRIPWDIPKKALPAVRPLIHAIPDFGEERGEMVHDLIEPTGATPSDAPAAEAPPERRSRVSTEALACGDPVEYGPAMHRGHDRFADGDRRQGD
jgi:hypothetical protein